MVRLLTVLLALAPFSPLGAHDGVLSQLADMSERLAETPEDAALFLRRGMLLGGHGDRPEALADLRRCEELSSHLPGLHEVRGGLLLSWGEPRAALAEARAWLRVMPLDGAALLLAARSLRDLGETAQAGAVYDRVLASMERPTPDHYLERLPLHLASGGPARGIAGLEEGLRRLPGASSLERRIVDLLVEGGRLEDALGSLDEVLARGTQPLLVVLRRAEVLEQAGRREEALAAFRLAHSLSVSRFRSRPRSRAGQQIADSIRAGLGRCGVTERSPVARPAGMREPTTPNSP